MIWEKLPFSLLKVSFLGQEEISIAVRFKDVPVLQKIGFKKLDYNSGYETQKPYTLIRYMIPPRKIVREMFTLIDKGEIKKVGTINGSTYYDYGLNAYFQRVEDDAKKSSRYLRVRKMGLKARQAISSRRKKKALELRKLGYSSLEISNMMGVSTGTIHKYFKDD